MPITIETHKPSWPGTVIGIFFLWPFAIFLLPAYIIGKILNVVGPLVTGKK